MKNIFLKKHHLGLIQDASPEEVPEEFWTAAANIQFANRASETVNGVEAFIDTVEEPIFTIPVDVFQTINWVYCSTNKVYVFDGITSHDITPAGGLSSVSPGSWVGTVLNNIPVFTNGIDEPFYWDLNVSNPCLPLPGWPVDAKCKAIRAFKYHLFALNITQGTENFDDSVWWSESAEPGTLPQEWTPSPSNDAGDFSLSDTPGAVYDALQLRDNLIIYKSNATYTVSYVAGQYIFTQRKNFLTSGVPGVNCVTEFMGEHYLFSGSDLIKFDGQTAISLVDGKVRETLIRGIDGERVHQSCVINDFDNNMVLVCIPIKGEEKLTKAYVINTLNGHVGVRFLPNINYATSGPVSPLNLEDIWDNDPYIWDEKPLFWTEGLNTARLFIPVFCASTNHILEAELNSNPVSYFLERLSMDLEADEVIERFLINKVVPQVHGNEGEKILVNLGTQDHYGQPVSWQGEQEYIIGETDELDFQAEGRLYSISFKGETSLGVKISNYILSLTIEGRY